MRTLLLSVLAVIAVSTSAQTKDATLFGYKGKVKSATVLTPGSSSERIKFNFNDEGNIVGQFTDYEHIAGVGFYHEVTNKTRNSITGETAYKGRFTATIANNRITKIVYRGDDETHTRNFTYNTAGQVIKIEEVREYYTTEQTFNNGLNDAQRIANDMMNESQAIANDMMNESQAIANDIMRNPLNALDAQRRADAAANRAANRANAAANRAANRANAAASRTGFRERRVKHTERGTATFTNYQFDDFGNWTSRTCTNKYGTFEERQNIEYDRDFWSQFYWERLEAEGNLRKIEAFAMHPMCSPTYKTLATNFWNERILDEVARVDGNSLDSLCHVSQSPIISNANKETALNFVRQSVYQNQVLPVRDYRRVAGMKDVTIQQVSVFNNVYRNRIDSLSNKLRTDSIQFLTNKAQNEFDGNKPAEALRTSQDIMRVDKGNSFAANMAQEASFAMLKNKELAGNIVEEDYVNFLETFPSSPHGVEVQNSRALLASSLFNKSTSQQELDRVLGLPTDEPTAKIVKKRYRKWDFRLNRGNFFHFGFGGEFAIGPTNTVAAGGIALRLGYTANIINLVAGAKFNYMTCTPQMFKTPKEAGKGYFERMYISVPVMLNVNVKHGYWGATYIGLGAELNVGNLDAKLRDVEDLKNKDFAQTGTTISPRVALGGRLFGIEIELFGTYDMKNPFNVDYINAYKLSNGQSVQSACEPDAFDKQINRDGFFDKVRAGLALRFWL